MQLPFREHDHLAVGVGEQFGKDSLQFLQLRAEPALAVQDVRRVAQHPHAGEQQLQALEFLLGQWPPLGDRRYSCRLPPVFLIPQPLLLGHADQVVGDCAAWQLSLHVALASPQQDRLQLPHQDIEVLIADRPPAFVQLIEVAVEPEQRPQQPGVQELDDGIDLIDAVLDRRAGQHERIRRRE
jgi:hypothetical protein